MKKQSVARLCAILAAGLGSLVGSNVQAYDLPFVNLGLTSFLDGAPPSGPGFYFSQYGEFYRSTHLRDLPPAPQGKLDVWASASQFIYQSDQKVLLGGKWGLDVIVPVVTMDVDNSGPITDNGGGLGDIWVGPYLQWDPIMGDKGPIFMHRVEFQCIVPTGKYDPAHAINPGAGFFYFDPYWAGTLFLTPKWTASTRVHYLWNDSMENNLVTTQAGQAIHFNYATEYEVVEKRLRVGINGYYLNQITDSQSNGVPGGKVTGHEQVFAVGPGVLYHINKDNHVFFNTYFETLTHNRTEGTRFVLRFVHHF